MRRKFTGAKRHDQPSEYHDRAMEELVKKLRAWLIVQPAWVGVLSADRQARKRFGRLVAREVTRIPPIMPKAPKPKPSAIWTPGEDDDGAS